MHIDFSKSNGLVPVIIQDHQTLEVLMLGYMNQEAYDKTISEQIVTFFSRSKDRLWTKGETSGNFFHVKTIDIDCDNDALLIKVNPVGPACHTGERSCFKTAYDQNFILELERIVADRYNNPVANSYINHLHERGLNKIAQKVGEEAVETVIAAINQTEVDLINEASDLIFHLLVLLREKNLTLQTIANNLQERHDKVKITTERLDPPRAE